MGHALSLILPAPTDEARTCDKSSKVSSTGGGPKDLSPMGPTFSSLRGDFPVTCLWLAVILTLHPPQKQSPVVTVAPARVILQLTNAGVWNLKLPWEDPYWELEGGFAIISKQSLLGDVSSDLPPTKL